MKQAAISAANGPEAGVILMMAATVEDLRAAQEELVEASKALVDAADAEERDLDESEIETIEANKAEIDKIGRQIAAREAARPTAVGAGRKTAAEPQNRGEEGTRRIE